MAVYLLGGKNGIEEIGNETICVHAGGKYGYGYSSSPDCVWVHSVDGDWVTFYRYPYGDKCSQREQLHMFKSIAQHGTETEVGRLRNLITRLHPVPEWMVKLCTHYTSVLTGHEGLKLERDDIRMVKVEFSYDGPRDGWSEFEKHYPHSVSGCRTDVTPHVYESYDFSAAEAAQLCHDMNCGKLPGFQYLRSTPRDA